MSDWISVNDRLPTNNTPKKFHVKYEIGSAFKSMREGVSLGRNYGDVFRFNYSDWATVTHWKGYEEQAIAGREQDDDSYEV